MKVIGQFADKPTRDQSSHGLVNSWSYAVRKMTSSWLDRLVFARHHTECRSVPSFGYVPGPRWSI